MVPAILDAQGQRDEAESLLRRAIAIFEKTYGPEHYELAVNFNNLAALRHAQGDARETEYWYRRALAIKERLLGAEHPDVAVTLNNLAVLYRTQGRRDEAEGLYRRALGIFEKALFPQHPTVMATRANYAALCREGLANGEDALAQSGSAPAIGQVIPEQGTSFSVGAPVRKARRVDL